jgi:hypothetical protein
LNITDERGFLIVAVNDQQHDYILCAEKLANSLKFWHPEIPVCLLTDRPLVNNNFDYIKTLPMGDQCVGQNWKLANDWQVWSASPFRNTIKLEADMLLTSDIGHWWTLLQKNQVVISTGARDFYNQSSKSRFYRNTIDENQLPDVYNAITYWRLGTLSKEFFQLVRNIFENWNQYRSILKFSDERPTTDLVYAVAAQIIGPEKVTLPNLDFLKIVHMKKHVIPIRGQDWTKELVWEFDGDQFRINTIAQTGFVHYHIKEWANKIEKFSRVV